MNPENSQENVEVETKTDHLAPLKCVTPVSKYLSLALFIILPFLGAWVGYTYAPEKVVEVEKVVKVLGNAEIDTYSDTNDVSTNSLIRFDDLVAHRIYNNLPLMNLTETTAVFDGELTLTGTLFVQDEGGVGRWFMPNQKSLKKIPLVVDSLLSTEKQTNGADIGCVYLKNTDGYNSIFYDTMMNQIGFDQYSPYIQESKELSITIKNLTILNPESSNWCYEAELVNEGDVTTWSGINGTLEVFIEDTDVHIPHSKVFVKNSENTQKLVDAPEGMLYKNPQISPDGTYVILQASCYEFCSGFEVVSLATGERMLSIKELSDFDVVRWQSDGTLWAHKPVLPFIYYKTLDLRREKTLVSTSASDIFNLVEPESEGPTEQTTVLQDGDLVWIEADNKENTIVENVNSFAFSLDGQYLFYITDTKTLGLVAVTNGSFYAQPYENVLVEDAEWKDGQLYIDFAASCPDDGLYNPADKILDAFTFSCG